MIEPTATPRRQKTSFTWTKRLIMPLALALAGKWFDNRIKVEKIRADAGYAAVMPALKEMQTQVATLNGQVQTLQQLVLVLSQRREVAPTQPTVLGSNAALDTFKDKLVVKVQKSQGSMPVQKSLPISLDDAVQTKK